MHDLAALKANSEPVSDYIATPSRATEAFNQRLQKYELNSSAIEKLKSYTKDAHVFVFSAEWCPDCHRNVPVLKLIADATGIETRVFGRIMKDAKNSKPSTPEEKWKVPPSPPELMEFKVFKIPYITVLNGQGEELGAVIENPSEGMTLEEALLDILEAA